MNKLILVAGARPNFMKIAPLMHALKDHSKIKPVLLHTGQHYDEDMSDLFFNQLNIPKPEINLGVGSASHALQTARIMERFETICLNIKPDMVLVVGDVNSTAACSLVASKMEIKTAHYEAGLRSHDRSMPEEINRIVTDAICDYFFTTSKDANENLIKEGKSPEHIFLVGNLMIDTLYYIIKGLDTNNVNLENVKTESRFNFFKKYKASGYAILTFHRPSNVDNIESLEKLIHALGSISGDIPLIFPVHPRTHKYIKQQGLMPFVEKYRNLMMVKPLGYLEFISIMRSSSFVMTDSGGIQEEATVLGIPCLTVRTTTERPITVWEGTNKLVKVDELVNEAKKILKGDSKKGQIPPLWDGKAAGRIVNVLENIIC